MNVFAPPLTVALLTYNRRHYLQEAIEAILRQSYRDFELLVLDNCSTDGTAEYVLSLADPRIRYIRNAPNNCTVTFNCISAYHLAIGRRVIATHDDDIMENDMLERQMRFLDEHPGTALAWCRVSDIDQDGRPMLQATVSDVDRVFAPGEYITSFLKTRLWPMPSGVMLDRAALPKGYRIERYLQPKVTDGNPMDTAGIADVLFPARVNQKHGVGYIAQPLLRRRVHLNQFSHTVSLSRPGVPLYRRLERIARGVKGLAPDVLHFRTFVDRFDIQEAITTNESAVVSPLIIRRIKKVVSKLVEHVDTAPGAFLAGLPIFLLKNLIMSSDDIASLQGLDSSGYDSATQNMLLWAGKTLAEPESSILAPLAGRRIIIFGSAFIAALLILEARRHGFHVVCCVDSNSTRYGTQLLDVPIHAPGWMLKHVSSDDVVIMSSERDHEHYIEAVIRKNLRAPTMLLSWKELLKQSVIGVSQPVYRPAATRVLVEVQ
ncbi:MULTISPECIES: glycosyltransferase family 2 protein [Stutzerimonas stutzeri subgroup]|uniref:glycosyltransferase family 2 protein n=1 Tax=Stutzerimonas stutzeri subgroup TaxID=578833 RepID=UPI0028A73D1F|nr:glycosyltransferase family A protein [Stutzerimonas chloritidismutans]